MSGEKNIETLLKSMEPVLRDDEYVFICKEGAQYGDFANLHPIGAFREDEGMTLVISRSAADDNGITYDSVFRCITLTIHSSLDAVGLTAAFSSKLADYGISANVMAGFYHDHIFVQSENAVKAMEALGEF